MWNDRAAMAAVAALCAGPAAASYNHAPFHDRPAEVAGRAFAVFEGAPAVVPADDPPLAAAVAALLLLSERGVAEAFEEAVEGGDDDGDNDGDDDGYAAAFALLQAVKPWIAALPSDPEIADLLARLDALMPTPDRPDRLDADPEAAEVVAQALVGRLETVADADLYLGRDLGRAIDTVAGLAAAGCAAPDAAAAGAQIGIAAFYFEESLEAPLSVMASGPTETVEAAFEALLDTGGDPAAPCADLADGFSAAERQLFPGGRP